MTQNLTQNQMQLTPDQLQFLPNDPTDPAGRMEWKPMNWGLWSSHKTRPKAPISRRFEDQQGPMPIGHDRNFLPKWWESYGIYSPDASPCSCGNNQLQSSRSSQESYSQESSHPMSRRLGMMESNPPKSPKLLGKGPLDPFFFVQESMVFSRFGIRFFHVLESSTPYNSCLSEFGQPTS